MVFLCMRSLFSNGVRVYRLCKLLYIPHIETAISILNCRSFACRESVESVELLKDVRSKNAYSVTKPYVAGFCSEFYWRDESASS
jgi:hypothetical protein